MIILKARQEILLSKPIRKEPAIIISIPIRNGQTQEVMIYVSTAVNSALTIPSNFLNHILKQDLQHQKELYNRI